MASAPALAPKSATSRARAASAIAARSAGLRMSRRIAADSAAASPGLTSSPPLPCAMNSGIAENRVETMARFWLAASISTLGSPSRSPSAAARDGSTNRSASRSAAITAPCAEAPRHSMRASRPSFAARAFSAAFSGPPPMWMKRQFSAAGRSASASSSTA